MEGGSEGVDAVQVVREHELERVVRVEAEDSELGHVADVEHARSLADGPVLVDDARVLDRHLVARERDHAGTQFQVQPVQGSLEKLLFFGGGQVRLSKGLTKPWYTPWAAPAVRFT